MSIWFIYLYSLEIILPEREMCRFSTWRKRAYQFQKCSEESVQQVKRSRRAIVFYFQTKSFWPKKKRKKKLEFFLRYENWNTSNYRLFDKMFFFFFWIFWFDFLRLGLWFDFFIFSWLVAIRSFFFSGLCSG